MKAAFTEWHGRIAPVFDVAGTVLMVETDSLENTGEQSVGLPLGSPTAKVASLAKQQVDVLVCGAISRHVQAMAEAEGIQVHPFIAGEIGDVLDAWMHGRLDQAAYSMPGCRRCRRHLRARSDKNNKQQGGISCHVEIKQGRKE